MSIRFAEREARRATGAPALESIEAQIAELDEGLRSAQKASRKMTRSLASMRAALEELRRDLASAKRKGR